MTNFSNSEFFASLLVLFITIIFSAVAYFRWYSLSFFVGSFFFVHWLGLAATVFIVVLVPVYYILKRRRPQNIKMLLRLHVFGNLFSFLLVSIHFSQNTGRISGFYPRLEDGFILFLVLSLIVITGVLERFRVSQKLVKYTKPIHRYAVLVFFLIMTIHVLQGFNLI